ncbi:nucleotidyltransferase family protein [Azoarcus taiwanensis]|uniref:Nucleotidyltransferase n=1 Tax=Azoarcus taiwanensis TaxID=666964 RepID=A0A972FBK4_9RHOO|nr:nucleotidyltransferase family protein [Azoarcus taiwanensis]NMG01605.1 nucleotidyltransferase [Azoarcus taiwanensis]
MKPSDALRHREQLIRDAVARFRVRNPRVFGSVLHGTDKDGSDLDLLVDPQPGTTLFDLGDLQVELEDMLGVRVDVVTPRDLPKRIRARVIGEAHPL